MVASVVCERDPIVPVNVTVKVPFVDDVHWRLAGESAPGAITLLGAMLQRSPEEGATEYNRLTDSLKPFCPVTTIVDEPELPTLIDKLDGLRDRVKSVIWNVTDTLAVVGELVIPVTVTE